MQWLHCLTKQTEEEEEEEVEEEEGDVARGTTLITQTETEFNLKQPQSLPARPFCKGGFEAR